MQNSKLIRSYTQPNFDQSWWRKISQLICIRNVWFFAVDFTKCAPQYENNNFVTIATYWVPDHLIFKAFLATVSVSCTCLTKYWKYNSSIRQPYGQFFCFQFFESQILLIRSTRIRFLCFVRWPFLKFKVFILISANGTSYVWSSKPMNMLARVCGVNIN